MTATLPEAGVSRPVASTGLESGPTWLRWAARGGYAACGLIYIAIGVVAAAVAFGWTGRPGGPRRVMLLIEQLPFGKTLLIALSLGLLGYAALNVAGAVLDEERRGRGVRAIVMRAADALTGALYVALAVAAVRIAAAPVRDGGRMVERWAAEILMIPGGASILGVMGLFVMTAGGVLLYRARHEPFETIFDNRHLSTTTRRLLTFSARFGTAARGIVLGTCGLLAVEAALTREARRVGTVGDALSAIETTPAGRAALTVVALGFAAYGLYQLAKTRYRRVPIR